MGTIYAIRAIEEAARLIGDVGYDNTSKETHLTYLNDAINEAVIIRPAVNPVSSSVLLVQGITQSLPTDAVALIEVPFNMGANGTTIGAPINRVSREIINKRNPAWTTDTASGTVKSYIYEEENPSQFDVYPPQPATPQYVRAIYSTIPEKLEYYDEGIEIPVADYWFNAIVNYMAYRFFSENSEHGNNQEKRDHHYQQFLGALGVTVQKKPKEA